MRILIGGGPRTGKTTLARAHTGPVRHTDDLIATHGWSEASAEVARWMADPGPWVIEGVAVARAIRKWLAAHPDGRPCDVLVWLRRPRVELSPGQRRMGQGCETVLREVLPELELRGVVVRYE